jgi:hydroxyethylthiazole kinase-like uncharacterized protein yjeF
MTAPSEWTHLDTASVVRAPTEADHKYSRGVLGMRTGSDAYPGAAVLGVEAAWRTGLGMVRYLGPERPATLILQRRPETVTSAGRVQAWVIGSGTDAASRAAAETAALRDVLSGGEPVVVDAGALDLAPDAVAPVIVTPHARELDRLRELLGQDPLPADAGEAARTSAAQETAAALGGVVLLKGGRTVVAAPSGWTTVVASGTPWLATAGTGDVLAGALGALVAAASVAGPPDGDALAQCAAAAAWLHGRAGVLASDARGGGPVTALDVAEWLPVAVAEVVAPGR